MLQLQTQWLERRLLDVRVSSCFRPLDVRTRRLADVPRDVRTRLGRPQRPTIMDIRDVEVSLTSQGLDVMDEKMSILSCYMDESDTNRHSLNLLN